MREKYSNWFDGTDRDWESMSYDDRKKLAFEKTGCVCAWPSWEAPVDCMHTECMIARGELPKIAMTNIQLRYEAESGWLRFNDRQRNAVVFRALRNAARKSGNYNIWQNWQTIVYSAVL